MYTPTQLTLLRESIALCCSQEGEGRDPAGYQANTLQETGYQPDTKGFSSDIPNIADPTAQAIKLLACQDI